MMLFSPPLKAEVSSLYLNRFIIPLVYNTLGFHNPVRVLAAFFSSEESRAQPITALHEQLCDAIAARYYAETSPERYPFYIESIGYPDVLPGVMFSLVLVKMENLEPAQVGTLHSISVRVLQEYAHLPEKPLWTYRTRTQRALNQQHQRLTQSAAYLRTQHRYDYPTSEEVFQQLLDGIIPYLYEKGYDAVKVLDYILYDQEPDIKLLVMFPDMPTNIDTGVEVLIPITATSGFVCLIHHDYAGASTSTEFNFNYHTNIHYFGRQEFRAFRHKNILSTIFKTTHEDKVEQYNNIMQDRLIGEMRNRKLRLLM